VKAKSTLAVAVLLSTFACTASNDSNGSRSVPKDDPPLTMAQTKWITDVLEISDKIDILFKNTVKDARQYFNVQVQVEEKYFASQDLLPANDTRAILLVNTVKAYQRVVDRITADEMGLAHDSPDEEMVKAMLRKALLRKIKSDKLTPEERKFVDDLRQQL
jgi:hypothetical protein